MKPRLAVVVSHPIQHFAPVYQYIAASGEVDLKVFFIAENGTQTYRDEQFGAEFKWDVPLTSGYQHEFLEPGKIIREFSFFNIDSAGLRSRLEAFAPDFIWVNGYSARANWRVIFRPPSAARIIYGSDSNLSDPRSLLRRVAKIAIVKYFFRRCHYFLSVSPANRRYLQRYGVDGNRIVETSYPVEMDRLNTQKRELSQRDDALLRTQLQIPQDAKLLLFAGKLIPHKRPQDILKALADSRLNNVYALFVGSGAMQEELMQLAEKLGVTGRSRFVGFINQSQIGRYFRIADIFVFPSEKEPYGAIAAETLPFGLPMVVSDAVGAIGKTVMPEQNALIYASGDVNAMAGQIHQLLCDPQLANDYSCLSESLADSQDKSVMARDIIEICNSLDLPADSQRKT